ncbi:MAG: hypothetical protein ACYTAF_13835, partial [Planctomycetota bacterium]
QAGQHPYSQFWGTYDSGGLMGQLASLQNQPLGGGGMKIGSSKQMTQGMQPYGGGGGTNPFQAAGQGQNPYAGQFAMAMTPQMQGGQTNPWKQIGNPLAGLPSSFGQHQQRAKQLQALNPNLTDEQAFQQSQATKGQDIAAAGTQQYGQALKAGEFNWQTGQQLAAQQQGLIGGMEQLQAQNKAGILGTANTEADKLEQLAGGLSDQMSDYTTDYVEDVKGYLDAGVEAATYSPEEASADAFAIGQSYNNQKNQAVAQARARGASEAEIGQSGQQIDFQRNTQQQSMVGKRRQEARNRLSQANIQAGGVMAQVGGEAGRLQLGAEQLRAQIQGQSAALRQNAQLAAQQSDLQWEQMQQMGLGQKFGILREYPLQFPSMMETVLSVYAASLTPGMGAPGYNWEGLQGGLTQNMNQFYNAAQPQGQVQYA